MTLPPPPGGTPPPPPPGDPFQPPVGGPGPYPGPQPHQPPWPQQPQQAWPVGPPPQKRGNGWKWALGAVALLAVIGVTAAITISVTGDDGGNGSPTSPTASEIASANDTGPATIITEDPTCAAWMPINNTLAQIEKNGWDKRDPSIPAANWTPELRAQYEEVGRAMRNAADQTVPLVKLTPHRVVRELYEQFIAYARAYSDAIPTYTPVDQHLVGVAGAQLNSACATMQPQLPMVPLKLARPWLRYLLHHRSSRRQLTPVILSGFSQRLIQLVPSGIGC